MGARFRLKASYAASGLSPYAQRVVAAMKKYGLVLADNGSAVVLPGRAERRKWPDQLIEDLKTIPASAFVAVDTSSLKVSAELRPGALTSPDSGLSPTAAVTCSLASSGRHSGCGAAW